MCFIDPYVPPHAPFNHLTFLTGPKSLSMQSQDLYSLKKFHFHFLNVKITVVDGRSAPSRLAMGILLSLV